MFAGLRKRFENGLQAACKGGAGRRFVGGELRFLRELAELRELPLNKEVGCGMMGAFSEVGSSPVCPVPDG